MNSFQKLLDFLAELNTRGIFFTLAQIRPEAIMIDVVVPGERWEVEFFADGTVEVEVFRSVQGVQGEEELERLFRDYSD